METEASVCFMRRVTEGHRNISAHRCTSTDVLACHASALSGKVCTLSDQTAPTRLTTRRLRCEVQQNRSVLFIIHFSPRQGQEAIIIWSVG